MAAIVRGAMAQQKPPTGHADDTTAGMPGPDPWRAFSYLVTGVLMYGLIGWVLDRWLGTTFLVGIGIVFGAVLGLYLTFKIFKQPPSDPSGEPPGKTQQNRHP
ncbi:AtpZ/AtpI family protein [Nocardioides pacificus]